MTPLADSIQITQLHQLGGLFFQLCRATDLSVANEGQV